MRSFLPFATLLGTAFLLGCQDVGSGPVGPDGPQFDKRGTPGALCGGPGEPVRDENGHCHGDEEATGIPRYRIRLTGSIFSVGGYTVEVTPDNFVDGFYDTNSPLGHTTVKDIFQLDIHSVLGLDAKACLVDLPLVNGRVVLEGNFSLNSFANPYLISPFKYHGADHYFRSSSVLPVPWPPTTVGPAGAVTVHSTPTGDWGLHTTGKNHRKGCTEEGVDIVWEAEVELLPAPAP